MSDKQTSSPELDLLLLVAHEIRAPLGIVKESISLVVDKVLGKTNEKQQIVLLTARRNVDRIDRVVMNLVDYYKLEASRMELRKEDFDFMGIVRLVLGSFQAQADAQSIELKAVSPRQEMPLHGDRQRLWTVLGQLVGNSVKFTPKGRVTVRVSESDGFLECTVEDTGIGIKEADMPKLFGKFQQIGWVPGGGEKGMGLGLAVAKGVVELHGGSMRADSRFGEGSRFTFTVPKGRA